MGFELKKIQIIAERTNINVDYPRRSCLPPQIYYRNSLVRLRLFAATKLFVGGRAALLTCSSFSHLFSTMLTRDLPVPSLSSPAIHRSIFLFILKHLH